MSQVINFPTSMNLSAVKETAEPTMKGEFISYASINQTYGSRQTIKIPIPSASNLWLHGQDCFISGRFKVNATCVGVGADLSIDGNAYSLFKNARLYNSSNLLTEVVDCNRLYHALFDLQVSYADRFGKDVTHCIDPTSTFGLYGQTIVSDKYMYFSMTLPMSIVGSLCDKSFPLGALKTGLLLELDVEDVNKILTTREQGTSMIEGEQGPSTAVTLNSIEIDQIYYHAKVSNVGIYNNVLMSALGPSVVIPSVEYRSDNKEIPPNTTSMTTNFSFPLKSAKNIIFWFTNTATATGTVTGGKLNSALTQRTFGGNMKNYYLAIDGQSFPSQPIDVSAGTTLANNVRTTSVNGSVAMQQLLRCFNLNSSVSAGGVLCNTIYSNVLSTWAGDATTKRAILGIDLDRGSNDGDKFFQGVNLVNSIVSLRAEWNSPIVESQTLYAYCMHDIGFVIQDGMCVASR